MKIARSHISLQLSQILIYLPRCIEADRIVVPVKSFRIAFCLIMFGSCVPQDDVQSVQGFRQQLFPSIVTYNNFFNLLLSKQLPLILQQELDVEQGDFSKVR